jgi:succinate dehydrogenase/fumarate reductase flavoprotein subunit
MEENELQGTEEVQQQGMTRRGFLGAAAVAGAAAGFIGAGPVSSAFASESVEPPAHWDYETDVVIVGYGGAGGHTAINAADAGAQVIVLEKYPEDTATAVLHRPSARYSGGICVTANDAKKASDHLFALSLGNTPRDVCDAWGAGAVTNVQYLQDLGAATSPSGAQYPAVTAWGTGEYPNFPGGDSIGSSTVPGGGPRMMQIVFQNVQKRMTAPTPAGGQIKVLWKTAGTKLVQDPDTGEIKGVVALQNQNGYGAPNGNAEITIKARRGVVLCTGGFEFDEQRKRTFLRAYPSWYYTNPNNSGEGLGMGQAVGGDLWHMNVISARAITYHEGRIKGNNVSTALPFFIVNKKGERWFYETPWPSHNAWLEFVNCSTEHSEELKSPTGTYLADPAWFIYDSTSGGGNPAKLISGNSCGYLGDTTTLQYWENEVFSAGMVDEIAKGWVLKADTVTGLATQIMADPENDGLMTTKAMEDTLTAFNAACVTGVDEFGRGAAYLKALKTPPFYAVKVYPGGPNTQGGLKKNGKGQVLDTQGQPIPRLYVNGENGSCYGGFYPKGGGNICEMTIFGRVVGKQVMTEVPWDQASMSIVLKPSASVVARNTSVTLNCTVKGDVPYGTKVDFQVKAPGKSEWAAAGSAPTASGGRASLKCKLTAKGSYQFQVVIAATGKIKESTSNTVKVTAR